MEFIVQFVITLLLILAVIICYSLIFLMFFCWEKIKRFNFSNKNKPIFKLKKCYKNLYYVCFSCNNGLTYSKIKSISNYSMPRWRDEKLTKYNYTEFLSTEKDKDNFLKSLEEKWKTYDDILEYEENLERECNNHNSKIKFKKK